MLPRDGTVTTLRPGSIVIPLVGNFTDDDGNGRVDLCDVPDVILTAEQPGPGSKYLNMFMLAGDTGKLELTFEAPVDGSVTPAFGDLDGDGLPDIVAADQDGHLIAFDNKGKVKWRSAQIGEYKKSYDSYCQAMAIYDLDGDGKPEVISAFEVYDNTGHRLFSQDVTQWAGHRDGTTFVDGQFACPANTAADLDGDGKLEVIFGNAAYHADGSVYWKIPGPPGQPQVGNLDDDPEPEIVIARQDGILVLEHDGKIKYGPIQSFDRQTKATCWSKPAVIHNFDGIGRPEIMAASCDHIGVFQAGATSLTLLWSAPIVDPSGIASSTAFDFLGRGIADAVYADEEKLLVLDGLSGRLEFTQERYSSTLIEYPVVADVDNDGSVDILVLSNAGDRHSPALQVFQDAQKRWIPGRRIWNQHAYHVTNVREDGTIPAHMAKSWQRLNTFRTNAQFEGTDCAPVIP